MPTRAVVDKAHLDQWESGIILAIVHSTSDYDVLTPRACTRGKAIGLYVVVIRMKIATSGDLGICTRCYRDKSVDIGEKLVLARLK